MIPTPSYDGILPRLYLVYNLLQVLQAFIRCSRSLNQVLHTLVVGP